MKGSMTNTDQLGYQFYQTRIYSKFSDVNMVVPVYEFIDIKGLEFEKEDFIRIRSEFRANVIVLGSKIASSLLNSRTDRKNVGIRSALP
jgi:hypothetical protein